MSDEIRKDRPSRTANDEAARKEAREEGVPPEQLAEYLEFRKLAAAERARGTWGTVAPRLTSLPALLAPCANGGFESGTFAGWSGYHGYNAGVTSSATNWYVSNVTPVTLPGAGHVLLSGGNDPVVGAAIPLPPPNGGSFVARLGNAAAGAHAYILRQTFLVDAATAEFFFQYALVFGYKKDHGFHIQPFFMARMLDAGGQVFQQFLKVADITDPFFEAQGEALLFRRWSCARFDLSARLGQQVTVEFTVAGCSEYGHMGYAYIDSVCHEPVNVSFTVPERACDNRPVVADGSASFGETAHFWSVQESDAAWNQVGVEVASWFAGSAGVFDLSAFLARAGSAFVCGRYYRVKLAVATECRPWQEMVRLIFIECAPKANAGPDVVMCPCGSVQVGGPGENGVLYNWTPAVGLSTTYDPAPWLDLAAFNDPSIPFPSVWTVTATAPNGCSSSDSVTVTVLCRPNVTITSQPVSACSRAITLTAHTCPADVRFRWTPGGATTPSITVEPDVPTPYTVQVSNQCGTTISPPFMAVPNVPLTGGFPPVQCPNVFTPNADGVNDRYLVTDLAHAVGFVPAYNATAYRFEVRNRWGSVVADLSGHTTTGFANRSIPGWDGIATQSVLYSWFQRNILGRKNSYAGNPVSDGTYFYFFYLQNCDTGWTDVCHGFVSIFR